MSIPSASHMSVSSGPITVTPPSPYHQSDADSISVPIHLFNESGTPTLPAEPVATRKRGRPRKGESVKGKAPVISDAPKRKPGRPRKHPVPAAGASSSSKPYVFQSEGTPHLVTFDQFHDVAWQNRQSFMIQGNHIDRLEEELREAREAIARHEKMFEGLRDMFCARVDRTLDDIVKFLDKHFEFKPPAPPS